LAATDGPIEPGPWRGPVHHMSHGAGFGPRYRLRCL